jgi:hypothetical protein
MEFMMAGEYCLICNDGREYERLNVHLRTKHGISRKNYEENYLTSNNEAFVALDNEIGDEVSDEDIIRSGKDSDVDKPLNSFLDEYDLNEDQLRAILRQGAVTRTKSGVKEEIKLREVSAEKKASKLLNKDEIKTTDLNIAEVLHKKHGYKVRVVGRSKDEPKYWVLWKN